ncbi:MAG: KamA family radical SAM protein [Spirochaetales bacterium]|nr:KamA family radical SAM protein [Spirochaetales bacterium]
MADSEWSELLKKSWRSASDLANFTLTEGERAFFAQGGEEDRLQFLVNPYYASLAEDTPEDPIRRQFIPLVDEYTIGECELTDPLGETSFSPVPRLIHRYRDRVLLLVTDSCAMYCRHCFRRSFAGHEGSTVSPQEMKQVAAYLAEHREVNEILLSGGDPLTCNDAKLEAILKTIREVRPHMAIRLATRIPVVLPQRITPRLVEILQKNGPLWVVTQFNHRRELTAKSEEAAARLIDRGIPVLNQSVLLRGVNDSVPALEELFQALVRLRIKPYYLFQGDLAAGTSHLRVPLEKGREIMKELRTRISGLALPVYAVDMPGGGGKIPLTEDYAVGEDEKNYYFRNIEGEEYAYPRES